MAPLYPNEAQARRYLDYWRILSAQKRAGRDHAFEVAAEYLRHLPCELAADLRAEFGFTG
ncbi:hypothetical protein [Methylobacterium sp. WL120]|uniref:hypothetical protein n=1 Tax=Methylobacterium sp. WL120 TaxID=2603887 RepID=UPI0011CC71AE|nr:hypothetical protein [Methylobacterium sp. WL120]TXM69660.1 hypothetical protein FV229_04765 [Methylobacterium sp. WL120]